MTDIFICFMKPTDIVVWKSKNKISLSFHYVLTIWKREKLGPSTCQVVMSKRESGSIYFSNQTSRNEKIIRQSSVIPIFVQNCKHLRKNGCMRTTDQTDRICLSRLSSFVKTVERWPYVSFQGEELVLRWTILPMSGIYIYIYIYIWIYNLKHYIPFVGRTYIYIWINRYSVSEWMNKWSNEK